MSAPETNGTHPDATGQQWCDTAIPTGKKPPPSIRTHMSVLDAARRAAILMVYLYHCLDVTYGFDQLPWSGFWHSFNVPRTFLALVPMTYGSAGVAVLFVISGFCIHLSHSRTQEPGFRAFFCRRFLRIHPPYLCALVLFALVPPWSSMDSGSGNRMADFFAHFPRVIQP